MAQEVLGGSPAGSRPQAPVRQRQKLRAGATRAVSALVEAGQGKPCHEPVQPCDSGMAISSRTVISQESAH